MLVQHVITNKRASYSNILLLLCFEDWGTGWAKRVKYAGRKCIMGFLCLIAQYLTWQIYTTAYNARFLNYRF